MLSRDSRSLQSWSNDETLLDQSDPFAPVSKNTLQQLVTMVALQQGDRFCAIENLWLLLANQSASLRQHLTLATIFGYRCDWIHEVFDILRDYDSVFEVRPRPDVTSPCQSGLVQEFPSWHYRMRPSMVIQHSLPRPLNLSRTKAVGCIKQPRRPAVSLPSEIWLRIFRMALVCKGDDMELYPAQPAQHGRFRAEIRIKEITFRVSVYQKLQLLLVNREFYTLGLATFYEQNTFVFPALTTLDPPVLLQFTKAIGIDAVHHLQRLKFKSQRFDQCIALLQSLHRACPRLRTLQIQVDSPSIVIQISRKRVRVTHASTKRTRLWQLGGQRSSYNDVHGLRQVQHLWPAPGSGHIIDKQVLHMCGRLTRLVHVLENGVESMF